jgi:hypothetical protein
MDGPIKDCFFYLLIQKIHQKGYDRTYEIRMTK